MQIPLPSRALLLALAAGGAAAAAIALAPAAHPAHPGATTAPSHTVYANDSLADPSGSTGGGGTGTGGT
jgi:hypothetical protein